MCMLLFCYENYFQNQNSAKPPPSCPFCRGEINGFESVIVDPFESAAKGNKKESSPNEFDDVDKHQFFNTSLIDMTILSLATIRC